MKDLHERFALLQNNPAFRGNTLGGSYSGTFDYGGGGPYTRGMIDELKKQEDLAAKQLELQQAESRILEDINRNVEKVRFAFQ